MGRIAAPYGVLGWVNVLPDTEHVDGLFDYPTWWVQTASGWQEFSVAEAKVHGDHLVARLQGVPDRDAAFKLKGKPVAVPRAQLPEPAEGEYYWSDLIGLEVENLQAVKLGHIKELFETGANDVIVIAGERERLVPFIDPVVKVVDLPGMRMVVDWDAEF